MTHRLLVMDDDVEAVKVIRQVAVSGDMESRVATTAEDFSELLDTWHPSLLVVDPDTPGASKVLESLAHSMPSAPLICTTDANRNEVESLRGGLKSLGLRISGMIGKPLQPAALRRVLRYASTHPQAHLGRGEAFDLEGVIEQLRIAMKERRVRAVYQPKVATQSGKVTGFEALARWYCSDNLVVLPDAFIPIAEQAGLISDMTMNILDEGLDWLASLENEEDLVLCVNLSAVTLSDREFVDASAEKCREHGLEPRQVLFELTETSTVDDPPLALEFITRLRMKGFHVAMDDVGTGHSSFLQLSRLPFSEIKIDKSFVQDAMRSAKARAIIRSFVQLGHNLNMGVIAEGVENAETLDRLHAAGCEIAQGYFIARPMPAEKAARWLRNRGVEKRLKETRGGGTPHQPLA